MTLTTLNALKSQLTNDHEAYQTPCFVYSASDIRDNYCQLKAQLDTPLMMSIKANHCTDLLHLIRDQIDGFEVASEFELNLLALMKSDCGFINNPSMSPEVMRKAVAARVTLTLDHPQQIPHLIPLKQKLKPVCLRLSSALFLNEGEALPKRIDHFGMDKSALEDAIALLKKEGIAVDGIHVFRGSHSFESSALDTAEKLPGIIEYIESQLGYALKTINLGGGFSAECLTGNFNFAAYRAALAPLSAYQLMHESGRGIFASAGYFMTTVVATKRIADQQIIVCDGGMAQNFLLAQTEKPIKQYAKPEVCIRSGSQRSVLDSTAKVVGSSCNREDVIGQLAPGSVLPEIGDMLIFSGCGAYNRTYSPIQFLGLTHAREYVMDQ